MEIIIVAKTQELEKLQQEITDIQNEITPLQHLPVFGDLDINLNNKLDKKEKDIIATKKDKLMRDKEDYKTDTVYLWRKPQRYGHRWRGYSRPGSAGKGVSFSDFETNTLDLTWATSGNESSVSSPEAASTDT